MNKATWQARPWLIVRGHSLDAMDSIAEANIGLLVAGRDCLSLLGDGFL